MLRLEFSEHSSCSGEEPTDLKRGAGLENMYYERMVLGEAAHPVRGDHVDGEAQGRPPADDDGEDAEPDGDEGDDDEGGRADGAHHVGPHPRAVE